MSIRGIVRDVVAELADPHGDRRELARLQQASVERQEELSAFFAEIEEQVAQIAVLKDALRQVRDLSADWAYGDMQAIYRVAVAALGEEPGL